MKHIKTYESFVNESHAPSVAEWDPTEKIIKIGDQGIGTSSGIRCTNGKIEAFYDGRGSYTYALGINCQEAQWEKSAPDMIDDLNSNVSWLGGIISRPIDPETKKLVIEIIKSNI